jgi:hypothetical protein
MVMKSRMLLYTHNLALSTHVDMTCRTWHATPVALTPTLCAHNCLSFALFVPLILDALGYPILLVDRSVLRRSKQHACLRVPCKPRGASSYSYQADTCPGKRLPERRMLTWPPVSLPHCTLAPFFWLQ